MTDPTATEHPFLDTDFPIRWSALHPSAVEPDISKALKDADQAIHSIIADKNPPSYKTTFCALEKALEPLQRAWGIIGHLDAVCNNPELRTSYNAMLPKVSAFFAAIPLNQELWQALKAFGDTSSQADLSPTQRRHVEETMADFREQGADLPPEQKKRAAEIQQRLSELTQKYSENCLDATNAWEKVVTDVDSLGGLPDSALAAARQSAVEKGYEESWRFTLQAPSFIAVMTHANDEVLRREVWQAYSAIGRVAPCDNQPLVPEILALRHEFAQLVGRKNFADHVTTRRMVGSGQNALDFTDRLHRRLVQAFEQETQALRLFKAESTNTTPDLLEPWETAYWAEKMRRAQYDFDEEALRPYFPIDRVINGLFNIAGTLFGIRIEENKSVETWHPEVKFYTLFDRHSDEQLGAFYADWHPRESKRGGAWMNFLTTGSRDGAERSPHLGLICGNLSPAVEDKPALLTHREVETIFHEFGHLLHHLCGEVEVKSLNGVNVAWDFVELPSQIMENWCWERESLDQFACHYETGETIPEELFNKMIAARNFRKADANIRQLAFGKMDLDLHIHWPSAESTDLEAFIRKQLQDYRAEYKTEPPSNVFHFGHLFSDPTGYAAGYYSYKWAEVLDADAFSRFREEGILNASTGADFRRTILAQGNAAPPAQLFRDFMGRDPDPEALLRRDGLECAR
ncbi:MAG: M3 family metallopeptidase [Coraliomargaritaceae bacterium]